MRDRIKEIRRQNKLSQAAFGKKFGMSRDAINNLELGRVEPKELFIRYLCDIFEVNETWLRTGEGEPSTSSENEIFHDIMTNIVLENKEDIKKIMIEVSKLEKDEVQTFYELLKIINSKKAPQ